MDMVVGYGGYGHHYGKRSADAEPEAEADPWYSYGGYGGYGGYGSYGGYGGHGYGGYGGGYGGYGHHYGKRSADAEPEAEADPWYSYGGYGGHGYGGHGYGGYGS